MQQNVYKKEKGCYNYLLIYKTNDKIINVKLLCSMINNCLELADILVVCKEGTPEMCLVVEGVNQDFWQNRSYINEGGRGIIAASNYKLIKISKNEICIHIERKITCSMTHDFLFAWLKQIQESLTDFIQLIYWNLCDLIIIYKLMLRQEVTLKMGLATRNICTQKRYYSCIYISII